MNHATRLPSTIVLLRRVSAATGVFTLLVLMGLPTGEAGGGEVVFALLLFLAALAIVVLLCLRPAAQFYAAHRARRAR